MELKDLENFVRKFKQASPSHINHIYMNETTFNKYVKPYKLPEMPLYAIHGIPIIINNFVEDDACLPMTNKLMEHFTTLFKPISPIIKD